MLAWPGRALLSARALRASLAAEAERRNMDRRDRSPDIAARVRMLRDELSRRGLAGFIVPRADEHQGEYVPARARRLAWLTGFSGSAGLAIILTHKAAIFVDGPYTLQVPSEVPGTPFK